MNTVKFDYNSIPLDERVYVKHKAQEIRAIYDDKEHKILGKETFVIGDILLDIRDRLSSDAFNSWVVQEAHISDTTASKYMKVVKTFGDRRANLENVSSTVLYYLTLPSYPDFFLEAVLSGSYVPNMKGVLSMRQHPDKATEQSNNNHSIDIQVLATQIAQMQQQINSISTVSVTPPEVLSENETLRKEVQEYKTAWEDIVKENQKLIEDHMVLIMDNNITIKKYESILEERDKIQQERDVLLENWNALSRKHKEQTGTLQSLVALTKTYTEEYFMLCKEDIHE